MLRLQNVRQDRLRKKLQLNEHMHWYCIFKESSMSDTPPRHFSLRGTSWLSSVRFQHKHLMCSGTQGSPRKRHPQKPPKAASVSEHRCTRATLNFLKEVILWQFFNGENPPQTRTATWGSWKGMDFKPGTTCAGAQISHVPNYSTSFGDASWREFTSHRISQERTLLPSLIQFIPVFPKNKFARHLIGDDWQFTCTTAYLLSRTGRDLLLVDSRNSCPGAASAFKDASHKDYLWAPSSGLKAHVQGSSNM